MTYFQEKIRWCRELSFGFSETRDYEIRGLNKWELAQYALGRDHKDLDDLLHDLLDWTRMYTVRGEQTRYVKPDKDVKKDFGSQSYKFVPKSNDIAGRSPEHEPSCWKCHKVGHVPKDCPVKHKGAVKCFSCQAEGHFGR